MTNSVYSLVLMALYMMVELPSVIGGTMAPSSIYEEQQALLKSGWWSDHSNISHHCHWEGISCNEAGSVTAIDRTSLKIPSSEELLWIQNLNVTAFPNLVHLALTGMGLRGSIHAEIATLTNLTSLLLSHNRLRGKFLQFSLLHYPI